MLIRTCGISTPSMRIGQWQSKSYRPVACFLIGISLPVIITCLLIPYSASISGFLFICLMELSVFSNLPSFLLGSLLHACYIFTKLTRPLIKYWRAQGLNVFIYIDDGLAVCLSRTQALRASAQVQLDLKQAGFVVNEKKSHWNPARRIQWLGFIVDSDDMKFYVSEDKYFSIERKQNRELRSS